MYETGYITEEQRDEAKAEKLRIRPVQESVTHAEFVAEAARQLIFSQYGDEAYSRGLNVYLTLNSAEQNTAYRALRRGILDYEKRQVYRGPEAYADLPDDAKALDARIAEALSDHPANDELLAAVVLEAGAKKVTAVLQSGDAIAIVGEGLRPATSGLSDKGKPQDAHPTRRGHPRRQRPQAKGRRRVDHHATARGGRRLHLAGSAQRPGASHGGRLRLRPKTSSTTRPRPGASRVPASSPSSIRRHWKKASRRPPSSMTRPCSSTPARPAVQPWEPKNYDGKFEGLMPLRTALAKSKNMVSIRVLQAVGVQYAQEWVTRFGFEADKHPAYLTMALGAGSVTPMQMAQGYAVFANGGHRVNPQLISRITDNKGRLLYEALPVTLTDNARAVEPRNAFLMSSLLQEVTRSGTAARAQATLKRPDIYGKTGTTNDSMDAWFAGYQKDVVAIVWIGYDQPRKLGDRETGGGLSLPVWIEYMQFALRGKPVDEITPPEGVINVNGEWFYEEYADGSGVRELGNEPDAPPTTTDDEKKSILDLFQTLASRPCKIRFPRLTASLPAMTADVIAPDARFGRASGGELGAPAARLCRSQRHRWQQHHLKKA